MAEPRPTLDAVARAAGVSRMTVSNAYNRPDQLSASTRAAVLETARVLGYPGPDPAGRSLRRGRSGTLGVLITEQLAYGFSDPGMVSFLSGVATAVGDAGQGLLLVPTEANAGHALVRNALVDAFVLCWLAPSDPAVADVLARRLPVVTAGQPRLPGVPHIGVDNARAAALAAEHLIGLGHTRFGVVTLAEPGDGPAGGDSEHGSQDGSQDGRAPQPDLPGIHLGMRARVRGFRRAVGAAGVPVVVAAAANDRTAGAAAARLLLDRPPRRRPSAVFAVTDVLALGVLDAAEALGVEVPGGLSVVGYDGVSAGATARPPLTSVFIGLAEQGRAAARAALDLAAGREPVPSRVRPRLLIRSSTAAAPRPPGRPRPDPTR